jgi:4,5-DOPA dioxygenase extradiol
MKTKAAKAPKDPAGKSRRMPAIFVGHGSPINAIEDNEFSRRWQQVGKSLPRPRAILCVSAHWETWGTLVTAMEEPRTIHDFGGFPPELYQMQYAAPGSTWLAGEVRNSISSKASFDFDWGLDHGCWSVLRRMFPEAGLPVVQLSLDYTKSTKEHYAVGRDLADLRDKGILIIGSGNMVHNLGRVEVRGDGLRDFNRPFGFPWAIEANDLFKKLIDENRHEELLDYPALGDAVQMAVPTPEHFLPLLYVLAVKQKGEKLVYFNDRPLAGSLTMTSFTIG